MSLKYKWLIGLVSFALVTLIAVLIIDLNVEERDAILIQGDASNGAHLLQTAGCFACHTNVEEGGDAFAGGPPLESPFGTFYAPNITSSSVHGIGSWDIVTFERAVRQGVSPHNKSYYPAFPYMSYRSLTDQDVADLFVALKAIEPVELTYRAHDVGFPFNIRLGLKPWRWMFSTVRPINIDQSTAEGRGRYLVDAVAHCGECHTPRNSIGAPIPPYLGGADLNGGWVPAIVGDALLQMDWTEDDLIYFLDDGMLPDGDYVGGSMVEVIDHGTSAMSVEDRTAIAKYLFSLVKR
ncbi:c-type cytochrome [Reinekea sp.]|jgi:mono/diheme cytochrome c family protein|uniref:c-type cytochrome n=1 Tax=Reinekea sp. TaxID=1970455 RepID=UPI0039896DA0